MDIDMLEENMKMMKEVEPPVKTIKDFITVVAEKPKKKRVIPKLKEYNLKKEELRIKGLKKKNLNNLYLWEKENQEKKKHEKNEDKNVIRKQRKLERIKNVVVQKSQTLDYTCYNKDLYLKYVNYGI